jgi:hypothetical protein
MADTTIIRSPGVLNPQKSERGVTFIPLPSKNISFLSPNENRCAGYLVSACTPIDMGLTPFFYEDRSRVMLTGTRAGSGIHYMNGGSIGGLILKICTLSGIGIAVIFNLILEYYEQKNAQQKVENELQNFRRLGLNGSGDNITTKQYIKNLQLFDQFLKKIIQENDDLREKYAYIETNYPEDENLSLHEFEKHIRLKVVAKNSPEKDFAKDALYTQTDLDELDQEISTENDLDAPLLKPKKTKFAKKIKHFFVDTLWQGLLVNMFWNKLLKPLYSGMGLLSFAYWALTIPILILTGQTASPGIFGIPNWISFLLLPVSVLSPFFLIRVYNWYQHGHGQSFFEYDENARLHAAAEEDFVRLMSEAKKRFDLATLWNQYIAEMTRLRGGVDELQRGVGSQVALRGFRDASEDPVVTAIASGVLSAGVNQVALQYISWVTADIMTGGMGIIIGATAATPIGWALLALSGVFCLVSMGYRYVEGTKAKNQLLENQKNVKDEDILDVEAYKRELAAKQEYLAQLKQQLHGYQQQYGFKVPPELSVAPLAITPNPTMWERILIVGNVIRNHAIFKAWNWEMNSIFITRILVPVGVAIFWSVTALSVLAAFSNPVTFAVIGVLGTAITVLKYYENYQKTKEAEYKQLPKALDETKKCIAVTELVRDVFKARAEDIMKKEKESYDAIPAHVVDKRVKMQPCFRTKPTPVDLDEPPLKPRFSLTA